MVLLTFLLCLLIDFIWARCVSSIHSKSPWRAAMYAAIFTLLSQAATLLCVYDWWLLIPACMGCGSGTFLAVMGDCSNDL